MRLDPGRAGETLLAVSHLAAARPDQAYTEILRTIVQALDCDLGTVWVAEGDAGLRPLVTHPPGNQGGDSSDGLRAKAFAQARVIWTSHGEGDSAYTGLSLYMPLEAGGDVKGVLELSGRGDTGPDPETVEAIRAVARLLAQLVRADQAEQQAKEAETMWRPLVEQIPAIPYLDAVDELSTTMYISPQVEKLLGYTQEEWLTEADLWVEALHPEDRDRVLNENEETNATGRPFRSEYRLIGKDGRVVWFRDEGVLVHDDKGKPQFWRGVMMDITQQKAAEEQVAFLAYHDALTLLPNRAMFTEFLELALARAQRHGQAVAVLFLDLDGFKLVNDSLGHGAGDGLLREVAERLKDATRETDLIARQGGDEFLLLLADLDRAPGDGPTALQVAESVAARVLEVMRPPFRVAGTEVFSSASVGIALFPDDSSNAEELLMNADTAMYQSKNAGPGGYVVYTDESIDPLTRLSLRTRLQRAVEEQQWVLHYQPIVDLQTGEAAAVEALVRWQDLNGGLIPPGEFIPLAEEMGIIVAIGDWVLNELARQWAEWRVQGMQLEVSFNLSPRQLWQPHLSQHVMEVLDGAGVDPSAVVVEVTESTAMTDPDRTKRILSELSMRGLRIALDDFGTGHSSLGRLKHFPVDILKVDRSFVQDLGHDESAASMVRAIVQLAQSLGMQAVAEGIETEEQHRFLVQQGCQLGQGFLFARPMPGSDIAARLLSEETGTAAAR